MDEEYSVPNGAIDFNLKVGKNLKVGNNIDAHSVSANCLFSTEANISTLTTTCFLETSLFLNSEYNTISPDSAPRIVYVDSSNNEVNIVLGTENEPFFRKNTAITFKDVSLAFLKNTGNSLKKGSYNINILVPCPAPVRMEFYQEELSVGYNCGYTINTEGGSVTLRYFSLEDESQGLISPVWVITDQFIGNDRN